MILGVPIFAKDAPALRVKGRCVGNWWTNFETLWGGIEFGSNRFKQFPAFSGRAPGGGSRGWFIYPTLRRIQPELVNKWQESFERILKEWA